MSVYTPEQRADIFAESRAILEQRHRHKADPKPLPPVLERPVEIAVEDAMDRHRREAREQGEREAAYKAERAAARDLELASQRRHEVAVAKAWGDAANPLNGVDLAEL